MKLTDYLVEFLYEHGINVIFGYQGSSVANIINSISMHNGMRFCESRNEQGAAFAASAYAKACGNLGVAVACSGPGAINLMNGIADAYLDSVPVFFITGQVSTPEIRPIGSGLRQKGFQEMNIIEAVRPFVKKAYSVRDSSVFVSILCEAYEVAMSGRPGPVVIEIPHDIQKAEVFERGYKKNDPLFSKLSLSEFDDLTAEESFFFQTLNKKIMSAHRPLLLIGGGAINAERFGMVDVLKEMKLPIVRSYRGNTFGDSNSIGVIGAYGNRAANIAVEYTDFLIVLGSRLDNRQTGNLSREVAASADVFVIDIDESELLEMPKRYHKLKSSAERFLQKCTTELKYHGEKTEVFDKWMKELISISNTYPSSYENKSTIGVNPNLLVQEVSSCNGNAVVYTADVGQNQIWVNQSICLFENQVLLQSSGLGSMGFAIPAVIGSWFATGCKGIAFVGDGGLQMNLQELETLRSNSIPNTIIVFNNSSLGLIRDYQNKALGGRLEGSVEGFSTPNIHRIADAFGYEYMCISEDDEIYDDHTKIETIIKHDGQLIVEVIISPDSTSFPEQGYGKKVYEQAPYLSVEEKGKIEKEIMAL